MLKLFPISMNIKCCNYKRQMHQEAIKNVYGYLSCGNIENNMMKL